MIDKVKDVPPLAWMAAAAVLGLGALAWHRYATDDADADWTTGKESQPPTAAQFPVPGQHGSGQQMACSPAFRGRSYAGSLASADFSVVC